MTIYQNLIAGSGFLQGPKGDTGPAANTNIITYEYVATQGQTTFTGTDANSLTLAYTPAGIIVTLNGSVLNDTTDFIATNGTSIVLTQAANAGDELNIYTFPAFNVANTYSQEQTSSLLNTKLNITGGTLTGNLSFSTGANLLVPVGTTAQRPGTATQGYIRYNTDLNTLESANGTAWANVGSGSSSGGGVAWSSTVQNTNFIAVKNSGYLVNTATGNVTVTLPATPTVGDNITFVDYGGAFSSNGLIFYPNGNKINANTINIALTTSTASIGLVYTDSNKGWVAYNGFQSSPIGNYNVEYLIVAGGGGGASGYCSGGGGAGGMLVGSSTLLSGVSYAITVGSGGAGVTGGNAWPSTSQKGSPGGSSSVSNLATAIGGGGGTGNDSGAGLSGGSGGGGAATRSGGAGGSGTAGQGNPGAAGNVGQASHGGGGGGGAGGSGSVGTDSAGGTGGIGATSSITGTSTYYAGGGGGGTYYNAPTAGSGGPGGPGGNGGGGPGGSYPATRTGTSGTNGLGGGGGGGAGFDGPTVSYNGGPGGSGVVILRYLGPQRASGGTISQTGGYTIHTFTSSGTFVA